MIFLIRGLPGSGKSTAARRIAENWGCLHLEADMFFTRGGVYNFNRTRIKEAHSWCLETYRGAVLRGMDVVVSNTFCQAWEIAPYLQIAAEFRQDWKIYVCKREGDSIHHIPEEAINRMKERWQDLSVPEELWTNWL